MTLTRCPVEDCPKVGGIWQAWQGHGQGVWVCADHYPLPAEEVARLELLDSAEPYPERG